MTRLERRARRLLRAYPASYRRDHGEEIVGTLLEASPAGRNWPLPRECRALIIGGLQARAAANGRLGARAGLRLAALLGVAIYLGLAAAMSFVGGWHEAPVGLLTAAAVMAGWLPGRAVKAVVAAAAALAWASYALASRGDLIPVLLIAVCLAVFVGLAAGPRPPRAWLLMPMALAATGPAFLGLRQAMASGRHYPALLGDAPILAVLVVLAAAVLWFAVDARPVLGVLVAGSLYWLVAAVNAADTPGQYLLIVVVPWVLATAALAAPALWRLRRQTARPGRSRA